MITPEHKALVATVTKWLDGGCNSWGLPSGEIRKLCAAIENLSAQCAQPQAGEPVAWRVRGAEYDKVFTNETEARVKAKGFGGTAPPLYAPPQPANPAQVTDARYDSVALAAAREIMTLTRSGAFDDHLKAKIQVRIIEAITAAIGAGEQAVAEAHKLLLWAADSFDAHAKGTKVCDEVEGYEESAKMYRECASRLSALFQPHPADERVVEAPRTLLTLTKFELADNANRQPWARAIAKAEAALPAAPQPKGG